MIHAYNKVYLNTVMRNLAALFDIAVNAEGLQPNDIAERFISSDIAKGIESGNPNYLTGKSATELLSELLNKHVNFTAVPIDRSPEFWAGWVFAYTQWYSDKTFADILSVISFEDIISLYNPYHEAAEEKTAMKILSFFPQECALKRIRTMRKLSQQQLSELSGVKLRSIQCYEQGDIDIENAQAETLYALAKTLDCSIEELLS